MEWNQVKGNWNQVKGKFREQWGKITDDDLEKIAGERDQLVGKVQNAYGMSKEEAEKEVEKFTDRLQ